MYGGMAEWLMALVLKTSDAERHRGFESLSLRQLNTVEKYPSGRRGSPAKGVVRVNRSESSNLSFSAIETLVNQGFLCFYATRMPPPAQSEAMNDSIFDTQSFCIVMETCT